MSRLISYDECILQTASTQYSLRLAEVLLLRDFERALIMELERHAGSGSHECIIYVAAAPFIRKYITPIADQFPDFCARAFLERQLAAGGWLLNGFSVDENDVFRIHVLFPP